MAIQSEQQSMFIVLERPFLALVSVAAPQDGKQLWPQIIVVGVNSIGLWEVILEGNQYKWFFPVALMKFGIVPDIWAEV